MKKEKLFIFSFFLLLLLYPLNNLFSQNQSGFVRDNSSSPSLDKYDFIFAVIKYKGGGDWYEGKVGVIELMKFVNKHQNLKAYPYPVEVELDGYNLFDHSFLYMTGHGNFTLSNLEIVRLRKFLEQGGFLFINDDYGMNDSVQREIKKVIPYKEWEKIPLQHPIYNIYYSFPHGAPKVHKHDGGAPQVYGIFHNNKLVILYTKNTDIGDGWAPYQVHKDPETVRKKALQFGFNVILYSFTK